MTNYHTTYSETKQWERVMMNSKYLCQIPLFDTCPFFLKKKKNPNTEEGSW